MSYFLWIEDFDNVSVDQLSRNVFSEIKSEFYNADQDYRNDNLVINELIKHGIYIEKNFESALKFVRNKLSKADYIILDINLPVKNKESDETKEFLRKFYEYRDHEDGSTNIELLNKGLGEFILNSGFYLFTELVCECGFPKSHIIFYSNHGDDQKIIKSKFKEAGITLPNIYVKGEEKDEKIKEWVKFHYENPYSRLRRGIIEGCDFSKSHIEKDDTNIQFRDFIKIDKGLPTIEIETIDVKNYLDTLSQFLAVKQPSDNDAINRQYRLFLRTLVHEWEENINANSLKEKHGNDLSKIHYIDTFAWLMKMTRNWVSHANLLEPLNPQIIAFLFLVNMRAMFKLPKAIQPYEEILLSCISISPVDNLAIETLKNAINDVEQEIDGILCTIKIDKDEEGNFFIINSEGKRKKLKNFGDKVNVVYRRNTGNPDAKQHDFKRFLFRYFWVNQKLYLKHLIATSDYFLPTLAHHIYSRSFFDVEKNTK